MALAISIGGVDALDYLHLGEGNPAIEWGLQSRTVVRMTLKDRPGVYRPAMRAPVLIDLNGTRIFGGVVQYVQETDWGDYVGNWQTVEAADWTAILETVLFNGIVIGSTLRDLVTHLITYGGDAGLSGRGFTVDPAQLPGPVIGNLGYSFQYVNNILDDLARISGWPWTVDVNQRVLFAPADGRPASFALRADNDTIHQIQTVHDVNGYVNAVWLQYGPSGPHEVTETWTGDGTRRSFAARAFQPVASITAGPPTVLVGGTVTETVGPEGDLTVSWWWRPADATLLTATSRATLGAGVTLSWIETAMFPGAAGASNQAEIDAYGEFSIVVTDPAIVDLAQANAAAVGVLRERGGLLRRLQVSTPRVELFPGHVVTVDVPERAVNNQACLVVSSRLQFAGRIGATQEDLWRVEHELVEGNIYGESWQKFFKDFQAGGGAGVSGSGSVGPPAGGGGGGTTTLSAGPVYAGGSRALTVTGTTAWTPISDFVDILLPASSAGMAVYTGRCHAWTQTAGATITVRVVALEAGGLVCGTSTPQSATDWSAPTAFHEFDITLRPTTQYYRMEAQISATTHEGYVAGAVLYPKGAA
jgi:hypothetical protein